MLLQKLHREDMQQNRPYIHACKIIPISGDDFAIGGNVDTLYGRISN